MNFMNDQARRVGKLQLEVDQGQARTLAWALAAAMPLATSAEQLHDVIELLHWLEHRSVRRWGVSAVAPEYAQREVY